MRMLEAMWTVVWGAGGARGLASDMSSFIVNQRVQSKTKLQPNAPVIKYSTLIE